MTHRPYASRIQPYSWHHDDGTTTPGVGIFKGRTITLHLTPTEALTLADTLVDLVENTDTTTTEHTP